MTEREILTRTGEGEATVSGDGMNAEDEKRIEAMEAHWKRRLKLIEEQAVDGRLESAIHRLEDEVMELREAVGRRLNMNNAAGRAINLHRIAMEGK